MSEFTILPVEFSKHDWHFKQIKREGDLAIYCKSKLGTATGRLIESFETIRIRVKNGFTWPDGTTTPRGERYPASGEWGDIAWTDISQDRAFSRLVSLQKASRANSATL